MPPTGTIEQTSDPATAVGGASGAGGRAMWTWGGIQRRLRTPDVVLISTDQQLGDDVVRLAVAAGAEVVVFPDAVAAAAHWAQAGTVILDTATLGQVQRLGLPRRPRVVVITHGNPDTADWRSALQVGAHSVVSLPSAERWLVDAIAHATGQALNAAVVLTVVGGRGGAGASTLAAALGRTAAAEGLSVYLLDTDPAGCGLQTQLGLTEVTGLGWQDLAAAVGRVPPRALRESLPLVAGLRLLTWTGPEPRLPEPGVTGSVLEASARDCDVVVVDLARWLCSSPGPPAEVALEVLTRSDHVLLVCPADIRSAMASQRLLRHGSLFGFDVALVVRGPAPGALTGTDIAEALNVRLLLSLAAEPKLDRDLDDGELPGRGRRSPLMAGARRILHAVATETVAA